MNFLTAGAKFNRQLNKTIEKLSKNEFIEDKEEMKNTYETILMKQMEKDMRRGIELMLMFKDISEEMGLTPNIDSFKRYYFITIRPDETKINFQQFYLHTQNLLKRKCFTYFSCTYEQKGIIEEDLGKGFHIHIIAHMTQRSKGEVLRDITNSVKDFTASNCVDVKNIFNRDNLNKIIDYILNYKSKDGHKQPTQQMDTLFREREKIPRFCHSIKSVEWQDKLKQPFLTFE